MADVAQFRREREATLDALDKIRDAFESGRIEALAFVAVEAPDDDEGDDAPFFWMCHDAEHTTHGTLLVGLLQRKAAELVELMTGI